MEEMTALQAALLRLHLKRTAPRHPIHTSMPKLIDPTTLSIDETAGPIVFFNAWFWTTLCPSPLTHAPSLYHTHIIQDRAPPPRSSMRALVVILLILASLAAGWTTPVVRKVRTETELVGLVDRLTGSLKVSGSPLAPKHTHIHTTTPHADAARILPRPGFRQAP